MADLGNAISCLGGEGGMTYAAFHWGRKLVFPSQKLGCSQNSEFPTWKYDIADFNGTISLTRKLVNTSFRAQWNEAIVTSLNT